MLTTRLEADLVALLRGAGTVFTIRAAGGALLYLSQILAGRWLGLEQYGLFSYVWSSTYLLAILASLGLPICSMRFVTLYRARSDGRNLVRFVRWAWLTAAGSGGAVMVIGWLGLSLGGDALPPGGRLAFALGFLAVPVLSVAVLQNQIARALGRVTLAFAPEQLVRPALFIVFGTIAALATTSPEAALFLLLTGAAFLLSTSGQGVVLLRIVRAERQAMGERRPTADDRPRAWLRATLPMLAFSGAQVARTEAGIILVGLLLSPEAVGIYAAAARTAMLLDMVTMSIDTMSVPKIAALHVHERRAEIRRTLGRALRLAVGFALVMMVVMIVAGKFLLGLFGPTFVAAYPALLILAAGYALSAAFAPVPGDACDDRRHAACRAHPAGGRPRNRAPGGAGRGG
ncbi:MAG: lipopolysaccharide biosynthesis protein, partial [Geminicoccaceae bacterium]|nr:lipopolysaccharide biosynthesis protein [Geminicoccaceae bacterium]